MYILVKGIKGGNLLNYNIHAYNFLNNIFYINEIPLSKYGFDFDTIKFTHFYMYASVIKNKDIAKMMTSYYGIPHLMILKKLAMKKLSLPKVKVKIYVLTYSSPTKNRVILSSRWKTKKEI